MGERRVLDHPQPVPARDRVHGVEVARVPHHVRDDDSLRTRRHQVVEARRVEVLVIGLGVDEDGDAAVQQERRDRPEERVCRTKHFDPRPHVQREERAVQRGGPRAEAERVQAAEDLGRRVLERAGGTVVELERHAARARGLDELLERLFAVARPLRVELARHRRAPAEDRQRVNRRPPAQRAARPPTARA